MDKNEIEQSGFIERSRFVACVLTIGAAICGLAAAAEKSGDKEFAGSVSCRQCHERFYKLWSTSHHGLAMQPYTAEFADKNLAVQDEPIEIGAKSYQFKIVDGKGWMVENGRGPEKKYQILHAMGGKNVYYFLTPLDRGRLQTLPLAFDVGKKRWFDTAASGVRHFPGSDASDAVDWKDPLYTFNTSCHSCHVSQLKTNYDLENDTYNTVWAEPGINCETCHGPSSEHIKVCQDLAESPPADLKIISTKSFTPEQNNATCASCHAKQSSISPSFTPGERYFDHFDLVTLEHPDYYPDGRDLGENYTYTGWLMSPCVKGGKLDCIHCHTSSGRYRFKEDKVANNACMPCHTEVVKKAAEHSHHDKDSEGSKCISCHMPKTMFARMARSDHSMLAPTPATSIKFKSPNACNVCHSDKDAAWSDKFVRKWYKRDYQKSVLEIAGLIDEVRRNDYSRLPEILDYLKKDGQDEVITATFIRALRGSDAEEKWPVINRLAREHPSPLVRGAAVDVMYQRLTKNTRATLLAAVEDEYRLVRIRAAANLGGIRDESLSREERAKLSKALAEYKQALLSRPDDYASHYNLGNFHMDRRDYKEALASYETSHKLRPDSIMPLNNMAFAYNALGRNKDAEAAFRKVLALEPGNLAANMNLGMLLGEIGRVAEAEQAFRAAYKSDPNSAVAAYNLGVILASAKPKESLDWCKRAHELRPEEGKYGYTYAYYLVQNGDVQGAVGVLAGMVKRDVPYGDAYGMLGQIYLQQGKQDLAAGVYRKACNNKGLSEQERRSFSQMLQRMGQAM